MLLPSYTVHVPGTDGFFWPRASRISRRDHEFNRTFPRSYPRCCCFSALRCGARMGYRDHTGRRCIFPGSRPYIRRIGALLSNPAASHRKENTRHSPQSVSLRPANTQASGDRKAVTIRVQDGYLHSHHSPVCKPQATGRVQLNCFNHRIHRVSSFTCQAFKT